MSELDDLFYIIQKLWIPSHSRKQKDMKRGSHGTCLKGKNQKTIGQAVRLEKQTKMTVGKDEMLELH